MKHKLYNNKGVLSSRPSSINRDRKESSSPFEKNSYRLGEGNNSIFHAHRPSFVNDSSLQSTDRREIKIVHLNVNHDYNNNGSKALANHLRKESLPMHSILSKGYLRDVSNKNSPRIHNRSPSHFDNLATPRNQKSAKENQP